MLIDQSNRLNGLFSIASYFSEQINLLDFNILFGWGLTPTQNFSMNNNILPEGLSRGLSVFGYLSLSYGLLGLSAFIIGYLYLMWKYTVLSLVSTCVLSGFLFLGAGSPLNYIYIYALIILNTRKNY
jgi:hypothetical protein